MLRCPNCNYELTFLERRHRYKCAKCSSLFTEHEIKLIEFKKYNNTERVREKEESKKETQKVKIEVQRKCRENNREEHNKYRREYWAKNRDRLLKKRKQYTKDNTEKIRIHNIRRGQKRLAEEKFEIAKENGSMVKILAFLLISLLA